MLREHANGRTNDAAVPRSLDHRDNDVDDPHERVRDRERTHTCAMHAMVAALRAEGHTPKSHGALRWVATYERAIARGDVKPCPCIPTPTTFDAATARGKSRPDHTRSERPRTVAPANTGDMVSGGVT